MASDESSAVVPRWVLGSFCVFLGLRPACVCMSVALCLASAAALALSLHGFHLVAVAASSAALLTSASLLSGSARRRASDLFDYLLVSLVALAGLLCLSAYASFAAVTNSVHAGRPLRYELQTAAVLAGIGVMFVYHWWIVYSFYWHVKEETKTEDSEK